MRPLRTDFNSRLSNKLGSGPTVALNGAWPCSIPDGHVWYLPFDTSVRGRLVNATEKKQIDLIGLC